MKIAAIAAALLLAGAIAWFAAEQRYDTCVNEATAEYPVLIETTGESSPPGFENGAYEGVTPETTQDRNARKRAAALDDCSRLPF